MLSKSLASQPTPAAEVVAGSSLRRALTLPSLPEAHRTIPIAPNLSWIRKVQAFAAGISDYRWLHGPWQLGHRHRRRLEVRLHLIERGAPEQPDSDVLVDRLRTGDSGMRSRGSAGVGGGVETVIRSATAFGGRDNGVRCALGIGACKRGDFG
jgi:hypothetical protein